MFSHMMFAVCVQPKLSTKLLLQRRLKLLTMLLSNLDQNMMSQSSEEVKQTFNKECSILLQYMTLTLWFELLQTAH
jgi:hypothetical protein